VWVSVNTGFETTCSCFGYDDDDLLIPVEPAIVNTQTLRLKTVVRP
jgi:hypothetical protein